MPQIEIFDKKQKSNRSKQIKLLYLRTPSRFVKEIRSDKLRLDMICPQQKLDGDWGNHAKPKLKLRQPTIDNKWYFGTLNFK